MTLPGDVATVPLMRSVLTTPATREDLLEKASGSAADVVMVDLEDSVSPGGKDAARQRAVAALSGLDWGRIYRTCRVNGPDTPWVVDDLLALAEGAAGAVDAVVLPKVRGLEDVAACAAVLRGRGLGGVALHVLVEDARAYAYLREILEHPGVESVVFGAGDFTASLGLPADALGFGASGADGPGGAYQPIRAHIAAVAKGLGRLPIDTPFPDFRDPDGYRDEARWAARAGYEGKWCIHPSQIPIANEVFAPTPGQFRIARDIVAAFDQLAGGQEGAAFVWDGKMIDEATARIARITYDKGVRIGLADA